MTPIMTAACERQSAKAVPRVRMIMWGFGCWGLRFGELGFCMVGA